MRKSLNFRCGNCGFDWSEEVHISISNMTSGFSLTRVCPQCNIPNQFNGGGNGIINTIEMAVKTSYFMPGRPIGKSSSELAPM